MSEIDKPGKSTVDFHVHYDPLRPETGFKVIELAAEKHMAAVALLAREEIIDDYRKFIEFGKASGVRVIPGIEHTKKIDDNYEGLISLAFDPESSLIRSNFGREGRREKDRRIAELQIEFLENQGFVLYPVVEHYEETIRAVLAGETTEKAVHLCEIVGSSMANRQLVERLKAEHPETWHMAQTRWGEWPTESERSSRMVSHLLYFTYFHFEKPGYNYVVNKFKEKSGDAKELIETIHNSGGAILYSPESSFRESAWRQLQTFGVDGIMAWHGGKLGKNADNQEIPTGVIREARRNGLLVLGGSDFQGKSWELGSGYDGTHIGIKRFHELRERLREIRELRGEMWASISDL